MLGLVILVFGFVFAICAALNWPTVPRPNFGWAALACLIGYFIFGAGTLLLR